MGYTTTFTGAVRIEPPLNLVEVAYLAEFAQIRHVARRRGAYFVGGGLHGGGADVLDDSPAGRSFDGSLQSAKSPPEADSLAEAPSRYCQWVVEVRSDDDGLPITEIRWDGGEKFYSSLEWMRYLIDNFLRPGAYASTPEGQRLVELAGETRFRGFAFDHVCNGEIDAQGEDRSDIWKLVVKDNQVSQVKARIVFVPDDQDDGE